MSTIPSKRIPLGGFTSRLPTLEATLFEVSSNRYLTAILQLAQSVMRLGHLGKAPLFSTTVAAGALDDEEPFNGPQVELYEYITALSHSERLSVVPFLRRLGFSVLAAHEDDPTRPMELYLPGHALHPFHALDRLSEVPARTYLYATSPAMLRLRGVLWCTSRLLAWKKRAAAACWAPPYGTGYKRLCVRYEGGLV